jgi:Ca2+-binding EF-hand superfamily protein
MIMSFDHVMTRDEVARHVAELFARLDTNRDGFVTKDEVEAIHRKMMGAMGMAHDMATRFHEGGMPMPDRGAMFDRLDANHDGSISRQEFMAGKPQVREERVMIMHGGPDGAPGAPGDIEMHGMHHMEGMHVHGMGMGMGGNLFEMADGNHDGRVSLAEAQAAALAHFDKADVNHDGKITPDERQQMHQTVRIERRSI